MENARCATLARGRSYTLFVRAKGGILLHIAWETVISQVLGLVGIAAVVFGVISFSKRLKKLEDTVYKDKA